MNLYIHEFEWIVEGNFIDFSRGEHVNVLRFPNTLIALAKFGAGQAYPKHGVWTTWQCKILGTIVERLARIREDFRIS